MALKCGIELENPLPFFYTGQLVRGYVSLTLEEQEKFQDLTFQVKGETVCKWTEKEGITKKDEKIVEYYGSEQYFKTVQSLFTAEYTRQDDCVVLTTGYHTFQFSFTLLSQLPTSFEGPYGSVKYTIQVIAKRPFKINDSFSRNLTVIHHTDLNLTPALSTPVTLDTNKNLYFLFSNQGTLSLVLTVPQTGYTPGQDIIVKCTAENKSKVNVLEIVTSLQKSTTYTVINPRSKNRVEVEKLVRQSKKGPEKGETSVVSYTVTIPQTLPSTMMSCFITVKYLLKIKAVMSGIHTDLKLEVPITIGTVPIHTTGPHVPPTPAVVGEKSGVPPSYVPTPPMAPQIPNPVHPQAPPMFPEPPPSYDETMRQPNPGSGGSLYPTLNFN